jgi:hypothetical protein
MGQGKAGEILGRSSQIKAPMESEGINPKRKASIRIQTPIGREE